ncbi:TetR family transcriptional regulator [Paracoccus yeei]
MTTRNPRPAAPSAKDRILTAAFRRFAAHSYHETHLRDIAADAGVDVAYGRYPRAGRRLCRRTPLRRRGPRLRGAGAGL